MDESAEKEMKLLSIKEESKFLPKYAVPGCGEVGRIIVSGYDTSLPKDVVETALRNLFSNCGRITDVCVSRNLFCPAKKLYDISYIYFIGEDAVEKALVLNGTDVGGWTVNIKSYPFSPDAKLILWLHLQGFDTSSHSKTDDIKQALIQLFSSCGVVPHEHVHVFKTGSAELIVKGEYAAEKVQKLDLSFMGHPKLVLRHVCYREIRTVHRRPLHICGPGMLRTI